MRTLFQTVLLLLTGGYTAAQGVTPAPPTMHWQLVQPAPHPIRTRTPLPFSRIRLVDLRYDTVKLGFARWGGQYKKLYLGNTLAAILEPLLHKSFGPGLTPGSPSELVLVVRTLWLKEGPGKGSRVKAVVEAFRKTESVYQPLFRMDTLLDHHRRLEQTAGALCLLPFYAALEKLAQGSGGRPMRTLSEEEFRSYCALRFQQPRLQEDRPKKGIYVTFQDFIKNRPLEVPFTVEKDDFSAQLVTGEGESRKVLPSVWGYCDGQTHFIRAGAQFFALVREQQTYEFTGTAHLESYLQSRPHDPAAEPVLSLAEQLSGAALPDKSRFTAMRVPLQIDMESGAIL